MTDLTPERLDKLEALANAATEGPWSVEDTGCTQWIGPPKTSGRKIDDIITSIDTDAGYTEQAQATRRANAAFIAASREAVPALITEVRRLRVELEAQRSTRANSSSS